MTEQSDISQVDVTSVDPRQLLDHLGDWFDCAVVHGYELQAMALASDVFGSVRIRARPDEGPGLLLPCGQWALLPGTDLYVSSHPYDIAWQVRIGRSA